MRSYEQIRNSVVNANKNAKYERMMKYQEKLVEETIKDNHGNCVLFIFSDREQFHGIEQEWFSEFYNLAKEEVENAGYTVRGSCIYWWERRTNYEHKPHNNHSPADIRQRLLV